MDAPIELEWQERPSAAIAHYEQLLAQESPAMRPQLLTAQPWYWDAVVTGRWGLLWAKRAGRYVACMPIHYYRKYKGLGPSVCDTPIFVQQAGPWGMEGQQADVVLAMLNHLRGRFSHGQVHLRQDFSEEVKAVLLAVQPTFSVTLAVNQQVRLPQDAEELLAQVDAATRKRYNKNAALFATGSQLPWQRRAIDTEEKLLKAIDDYIGFMGLKTLGLQGKHLAAFKRLAQVLRERNHLDLHHYLTVNGELVLMLCIAEYKGCALSLFGGPGPEGRACKAQDYAVITAMQRLQKSYEDGSDNYPLYDFEGSSIPAIQSYNNRFGGKECHYVKIKW